ncbi:(d)CMP kinase [Spirosoma aerophilum]
MIYTSNTLFTTPRLIIAVDGYSGCGKSTTAKQVAAQLEYAYIDTGAMYRAVTLYFLHNEIVLDDLTAVRDALMQIVISFNFDTATGRNETYLNGISVEDEIRKLYVANAVTRVSALPDVRQAMVKLQQQAGKKGGIVMDGRDIGTHVFPDADLKVFMTADPYIRAERRQAELLDKGNIVGLNEILDNIKKRDHDDTTRAISPLRRAEDAVLLDTSYITIREQVSQVVQLAMERINQSESVMSLDNTI